VIAVGLLLACTVAAAWLAAIGLLRLPTPLARLHGVTFASVACGLPLTIAVLLADGLTDRTLKTLFLLLVMLASGAVLSHATGRAIAYRAAAGEPE
jgi:multisubunit Na+/H+ antiporter MnhG subunit